MANRIVDSLITYRIVKLLVTPFNRQEAYEDSSSESARYLDEVDDWRDNMDEYTM